MHPVIARAGAGELPNWSVVSPARIRHMARVADLLAEWAGAYRLSEEETLRWRAAGMLHDALREADERVLVVRLPSELADLPPDAMHGPVAAERLREEGVEDEDFLHALAYHTIGHPKLDRLGRALYAADFLEPGRKRREEERAELRRLIPRDPARVLVEVARVKIGRMLEERLPMRTETCEFWNVLLDASDE